MLTTNPVLPFLNANTLQIIGIAVFTGVALLILGDRARHISRFVEESGTLMQFMMEQVCRLIPLFVFVSLVRQIWAGTVGHFLDLWRPLALFLLASLLFLALVTADASLRTRCPPLRLLKKALPGFLIAFTTASSMSSYSTCQQACEEKLGVSPKLFSFGFPTAIVLYMPGGVVTFTLLAGYLAEVYAVPVNPAWFLLAVILAAVLSLAIPPTPGAMLTCYGILLAQLGIPQEGILIAITLDVILDFCMTGIDVLALQLELTAQAGILHMLDREKLMQP